MVAKVGDEVVITDWFMEYSSYGPMPVSRVVKIAAPPVPMDQLSSVMETELAFAEPIEMVPVVMAVPIWMTPPVVALPIEVVVMPVPLAMRTVCLSLEDPKVMV